MDKSKQSIISGELFEKIYSKNNYIINYEEVEKEIEGKPVAIIYFSSSGIYYPNTEEAFYKAFIENDRYEFLKSDLRIEGKKNIFVRDVAKQFYITGISRMYPDMKSLLKFLEKETQGYSVITVGSSAGGYAAVLAGSILNAELVYCFSGYFNLWVLDREIWPYITKYEESKLHSKFFDLKEYIYHSNTKIVYFFPDKLEGDREQSKFVEGLSNVVSIGVDSDIHGVCISKKIVKKLFMMDQNRGFEYMHMFSIKYSKVVKNIDFFKSFFGKKWLYYWILEYVNKKYLTIKEFGNRLKYKFIEEQNF